MGGFIKERFALLLILIVFLVFKIPQLYFPYYGDEALFLAPGASEMYSHGISLLPSAIDPEYGRGHPLLFQALCALWMHVFGTSSIALHSFCLVISAGLLIVLYEFILRLFNKSVAIICVLLLVLNTPFFIDSTFLAPDIFIAALTFGTIYFYATKRFFLAFLCLTMYFYAKESAFVLGAVLGVDALISIFKNNIPTRTKVLRFVSVFLSMALGVLFYVIQKKTMGWYAWPGAFSKKATLNLHHFCHWYRICLGGLLYYEKRYLIVLPILFLSLYAAIKKRNYKYAFIFLPAVFLFILRFIDAPDIDILCAILLVLFFVAVAISIYALRYYKYFDKNNQQKFVLLSAIFIFSYFCFFSVYNFQPRYIFSPLVLFSVLISIFFDFFIARTSVKVFIPTLIVFCSVGIYCITCEANYIDLTLFLKMKTQINLVDYFEQNQLYNKTISSNSQWCIENMTNPENGFLHSNKIFDSVTSRKNQGNSDYIIYTNSFTPFESERFDTIDYLTHKNDASLQLVYKKENGPVWAEVYKRK